MAGLYIHIPFCKQACHYCDFHFSTNQEFRHELVLMLAKEIRLRKDYIDNDPLKTIYLGGGTPSLLTSDELTILFEAIQANFSLSDDPEITLEANPDDLSPEKLSALRAHGVNRLSIGIQSFDDDMLRFLNRVHTSSVAVKCVDDAHTAGFNNISIDMMYALPGQSSENWMKNMDSAIRLAPEHISAYSLTFEEKTTFGRWQKSGKIKAPTDDLSATQLELLMDSLGRQGYEHYEISNFALPGYHSRHNSGYWKQEGYLGIGPGAHSYDRTSRQWNVSNNALYIKSLAKDVIPAESEILSLEDKINEYILTTLRTQWGCDLEKIKNEFQRDMFLESGDYLKNLEQKKLATIEGHILRLTQTGKLLADKIAADLFADAVMDN